MPIAGRYKYGTVLAMVAAFTAFATAAAPEGELSRVTTGLALGAILIVAMITAGTSPSLRFGLVGGVVVLAMVVVASAVIAGEREWLANAVGAVFIVAIAIVLFRGILTMLRDRGVTAEAVAGGLAIYLLIGLFFAMLMGFVADLSSQPFFADGRSVVLGERVYFSFTTLTTTGFGDPVVVTSIGQSIAVSEMLIGQIYLVTVIALLVSRARPKNRTESANRGAV